MKKDEDNFLKNRTLCKSCYHKKGRENEDIQDIQPSVDLLPQNSWSLFVAPASLSITHPGLKILSRKIDRAIYIVPKSTLEQHSGFQIRIKEFGEKIKLLSEYENAIIVFGDILSSSNCKYIVQFS